MVPLCRGAALNGYIFLVLTIAPKFSSYDRTKFTEDVKSQLIIVACLIILSVRVLRHRSFFQPQSGLPDLIQFVFNCCIIPCVVIDSPDASNLYKTTLMHRRMGMYAVGWRSLIAKHCDNPSMALCVVALLSTNELYWTNRGFQDRGEDMPPEMVGALVALTLVYLREYWVVHAQRQEVQSLQHAFADEKTAQEALISMLCDAHMLLGLDGDTVVRSTPQLNNVMEQDMVGTSLQCHMPANESERARLADALAHARSGPVALPVTLLSKGNVPQKMDFFIVRRHEKNSDAASPEFGFLVGVRIETSLLDENASAINSVGVTTFQSFSGNTVEQCNDEEMYLQAASEVGDHAMDAGLEDLQVKNISDLLGQPISAAVQSLCAEADAPVQVKNTFLCFERTCPLERRGACSAPPTLCGFEGHDVVVPNLAEQAKCMENCDRSVSSATVRTDWSEMWCQSYNQAHQQGTQHMTLFSTGSPFTVPPEPTAFSSEVSSDASSSIYDDSQADEDDTVVKVGYTIDNFVDGPSAARLTDILTMQAHQVRSVGSAHPKNGQCEACSFHFTYIRTPATRRPCKASYMCEFCHDVSHHDKWRSRFRKARKAPTLRTLSLSNVVPFDSDNFEDFFVQSL